MKKTFKSFYEGYKESLIDESFTPFDDGSFGFSVVRSYKRMKGIPDKYKCMIHVWHDNGLYYTAKVMVKAADEVGFNLPDRKKHKDMPKFIDFYGKPDDETNAIYLKDRNVVSMDNVEYDVEGFVHMLFANHIRKAPFLKMKILSKRMVRFSTMHLLYFFNDQVFSMGNYISKKVEAFHFERGKKPNLQKTMEQKIAKVEAEPFFKIFKINKNILSVFLLIILFVIYLLVAKGVVNISFFEITNLFILIPAFLYLYFLDRMTKLAIYLAEKYEDKVMYFGESSTKYKMKKYKMFAKK